MVGLGATYEIWHLSGKPRQVAAADFQIELISIDFFCRAYNPCHTLITLEIRISNLSQFLLQPYPKITNFGLLIENDLSGTAKFRNDKTLFLRGF